jgi:hypothetical protein
MLAHPHTVIEELPHDREFQTASFEADSGRNPRPGRSCPTPRNGLETRLEVDIVCSAEWPDLSRKRDSPADADEHEGEKARFDECFSADAGEGD